MRIITLKRLTINGNPILEDDVNEGTEDPNDWWCVMETKTEETLYDKVWGTDNDGSLIPMWNNLVNDAGVGFGLFWGDDDIYGYIRPDEDVPDIGEEFVDSDGDRWIRVE